MTKFDWAVIGVLWAIALGSVGLARCAHAWERAACCPLDHDEW